MERYAAIISTQCLSPAQIHVHADKHALDAIRTESSENRKNQLLILLLIDLIRGGVISNKLLEVSINSSSW